MQKGSKLKRSIGEEKQHIEAFSDIDYDLIIWRMYININQFPKEITPQTRFSVWYSGPMQQDNLAECI